MQHERRKWLAASGALIVTGALGTLTTRALGLKTKQKTEERQSSASQGTIEMARLAGYFPNAVLTTHDNRQVRFYDDLVRDKVVVIGFMYTNCGGTCPLTMANLVAVKDSLGVHPGQAVHFYGVTLDPAHDTPAVLAAYADKIGVGAGFTFLTGREQDITLIRRKLGVYDPDPAVDADREQHSGLVVMGNEPVGRWAALPAMVRPERIVRTLARVAPALVSQSVRT